MKPPVSWRLSLADWIRETRTSTRDSGRAVYADPGETFLRGTLDPAPRRPEVAGPRPVP